MGSEAIKTQKQPFDILHEALPPHPNEIFRFLRGGEFKSPGSQGPV